MGFAGRWKGRSLDMREEGAGDQQSEISLGEVFAPRTIPSVVKPGHDGGGSGRVQTRHRVPPKRLRLTLEPFRMFSICSYRFGTQGALPCKGSKHGM